GRERRRRAAGVCQSLGLSRVRDAVAEARRAGGADAEDVGRSSTAGPMAERHAAQALAASSVPYPRRGRSNGRRPERKALEGFAEEMARGSLERLRSAGGVGSAGGGAPRDRGCAGPALGEA